MFASAYELVTVSVYAAGLLAMLGFSAAYNLWPISPRKWILRRFDHSAIYVLIAATYTPIFAQLQDRTFAMSLLAGSGPSLRPWRTSSLFANQSTTPG